MLSSLAFSTLALVCVEAAALGAPVAVAQGASEPIVIAQVAIEDDQPAAPELRELTAPPAEDLSAAPVSNTDDNIILDEEQFTGPLAFEGVSDDEVVRTVFDALAAVTTLKGDFTQIAPSGAVSEGQFYLRRPGLLRFEYDPPTPLLIVANSGVVYVRDDALETTDSYPVGRTPLKYLLRDKIDTDEAEILSVDRGVDTVAVTLGSKNAETDGEISIILDADELTLRRWIVRDMQSGVTIVTLENVVAGERLATRLFRAPDAGGTFLKN
ncbi:MAG: outer-membrane lipoprotein carrier protein LolA [Pseudomonadota bacterium]